MSFVPFDRKGDPIEPCKVALISQGFRPGIRVTSADGALKTTVAISGDGSVEIEDGDGKELVPHTEFLASYEKSVAVEMTWLDLDAGRLQENADFQAVVLRNAVMIAIQAFFETHVLPVAVWS